MPRALRRRPASSWAQGPRRGIRHRSASPQASRIGRAELAVDTAIDGSKGRILSLRDDLQQEYVSQRTLVHQRTAQKLLALQTGFEARFLEFAELFPAFLTDMELTLSEEEAAVLNSLPASSWRAWLWPTSNDHLRSAVRSWFSQARAIVAKERERFTQISPRSSEAMRIEIARFVRTYVFECAAMEQQLAAVIHTYLTARDEAKHTRRTAAAELTEKRDTLLHHFAEEVTKWHEGIVGILGEWNEKVRLRSEALKREAQAVGIDL